MSISFRRRPTQDELTRATYLVQRGTDLYMSYIRSPAANKIPQLFEAIQSLTAALDVFSEGDFPREWSLIQNNLGGCYRNLPTANKRENVGKAIEHYNAALRVYVALGLRDRWASTQYNLGNAYLDLPTDDRAETDRTAIQCYRSALEVRTEQDYPVEWARTLNSLGSVYAHLLTGDRKDNLLEAIQCYRSSLRVLTESRASTEWAAAHMHLGDAFSGLAVPPHDNEQSNIDSARSEYELASRVFSEHEFPTQWATMQLARASLFKKTRVGSRSDNLNQAIAHLQNALRVFTQRDFPRDWARTQCSLAEIYEDLPTGRPSDNLNQALGCYLSTLHVYSADDAPLEWARVETDIARIYTELPDKDWASRLSKAIACCRRVLQKCSEERTPLQWATAQIRLGDAYRGMRDKEQERLRQSLDCYNTALRASARENFPELWASIHLKIGRVYADLFSSDRLNNVKQAVAHLELALHVFTKDTYPQTWGRTQDALGGAYVSWPGADDDVRLEAALQHYNAALEVFTRRDYPEDWARTLNNVGGAYSKLRTGDPNENLDKALTGYTSAAKVFTEQDYPVDWAALQGNMGKAYCELEKGDKQDNLKRAISCFHAALRVLSETEFPQMWATCQHNLGAAYAALPSPVSSDLENAIACYLAALRVQTERDHPEDWARTQNSLGNVYRKIASDEASFKSARSCFNAALRVYTEQNVPWDWATVQINIGALYSSTTAGNRATNLRAAIYHFQCALRVDTESGSPSRWAMTQSNIGAAYIGLKEVEPHSEMAPAIEALRASLRVLAADVWPFDRLVVLQNLSTACFREQLWEDTLALSVDSIALLENVRSAALTQQERHRVLSEYSAMFERAVIACVELKKFREALFYTERGKTRNLMDSLVRRDTKPQGVESSDWNAYLALLRDLQSLERELQSDDRATQAMSLRYRILSDRLELVRNELAKLEILFREAAPDYLVVARPLEFADFRAIVRQTKSVLIEFRVTERGTYVFLIGSEDEDVTERQVVHVPGFASTAVVRLLVGTEDRSEEGWLVTYDLWRRGKIGLELWMQCLKRTGAGLYALLLRPVLERIRDLYPSESRLILVPNQRLHLLPLHAAFDVTADHSHYLLDSYEICYAPSCSVLRQCLDWDEARRERESLFAVQNPRDDLAFGDWDVEEAARYFKRTCILAGGEASLSRVKGLISQGNEVLLSCHGRYSATNVWDSELLLQGQDCLKQAELLELDLSHAWLVVLSACETNVADYRDVMDEVQGMHTAFLMARAPTVIGTLWSVNDLSTALLMKRFHENLYVQAMRRAEAIREAQLWLRDLQLHEVEEMLAKKRMELVRLNAGKRVAAIDVISAGSYLADLAAASNGRPFAHPHWWAAFQCVGAP